MPHVITRHQSVPSNPVFFVNYDDSYIMKVTTMQAGGGALGSLLTFFSDSDSIYAVNASTVGADERSGGTSYLNRSTDSGSVFTRTYTIGTFHLIFLLTQHYLKDLTNDQLIWHGTADASDISLNATNAVALYTKDGGATWNRTLLENYVGKFNVNTFAVPAHDGRYAYIVVTLFQSPSTYSVKIYKVDSNDGSFTSITLAAGSWGTGDTGFFRGTVKLGNTDKLYLLTNTYGSLWTVIYSTNTSTLIYDGNGASQIDPQQASHRQITCSPSGTLLWVISNSFGVPAAFLYVFRSTDGTNWTKIDCSSLAPVGRSSDRDYISFSSDTLFVAFERDTGVVYGMFSTDDGASWARTGNLYTGTAITAPFDSSGVIAGG